MTPTASPCRFARFSLPLLAIAAFTLGASGCGGSKPAGSGQSDAAQVIGRSPVDLYKAGHFSQAKAAAEANIPASTGRDREVNQLTAGLSAYALHQPSVAERYLDQLTDSTDPQIAGRAEVVLAQIADSRGEHTKAAELFRSAGAKLDGPDAAKAAARAAESVTAAASPASPIHGYPLTTKAPESMALHAPAKSGPYTIQAGVFTTRASAEKRAAAITSNAKHAGLASPRVVPDTIAGRPAFAVQIGAFANRQAAIAAKTRMGTGDFLVVMAD